MRNLLKTLLVLCTSALVACGGGGGSPGVGTGGSGGTDTPQALFSTAPSSVTLNSGSTVSYQIGGGTTPYNASSDTPANVSASVSGSTLTLNALQGGNAGVTITDAKGTKISMAVVVPLPGALYTTAPGSLSLVKGSSGLYLIGGGVAPYTAVSASPANVSASVNGNSLALTAVLGGASAVSVVDSKGDRLTVSVSVPLPGALFTTAPDSSTLLNGSNIAYQIGGGSAPYTAVSNAPSLVSVALNGSALTLSALQAGNAAIAVTDSSGARVIIAVNVPQPGALFTTAPSSVTVAVGMTNTFSIGGGTAPYTAVSSNTAVATSTTSGTGGALLDIRGIGTGASSVVISDATGKTVSVSVTVPDAGTLLTTAPAGLVLTVGQSGEYLISGGVAPYVATSSNTSVVGGVISTGGKLVVTAVSSGAANVVVSDAGGRSVAISITVPNPPPLTVTAPITLTLNVGAVSDSFVITGGVPFADGYRVVSGAPSIATANLSSDGRSVSVTAASAGQSTITVRDSQGGSSFVTFTVSVLTPIPLSTSVQAVTVGIGNSSVVTASGGNPALSGYTVNSSNSDIAVATVSNGSFITVVGRSPGATTLTVADSKGSVSSIAVTVPVSAPLFTNAPATVNIGIAGSATGYLVDGGVAPYSVVSTDTDVLTIASGTIGKAVNIVGKSSGPAAVVITDSANNRISFNVNVASGSVSAYPSLSSGLPDSTSNSSNAIAASGYTDLRVILRDPSGNGIANQLIEIAPDAKLIFPDGNTALTNTSGVASFRVGRASVLVTGAGAMVVRYNYVPGAIATYPSGATPPGTAQVVTNYIGYQLAAASFDLSLNVGDPTLPAYGTRQITVTTNLVGTPVLVNFSSTCGQITPSSSYSNSSGVVTVSYSASDAVGLTPSTLGCGGRSVDITASAPGAAPKTSQLGITAAAPTNLSFINANPSRIYLAESGGPRQSSLAFKLFNAMGEAIPGQTVTLSLEGQIPLVASKASFDVIGNTAPVERTTDSNGAVGIPVFSGDVPTNVVVRAVLKSNTSVKTDSSTLSIASGRPAQARMSISLEKFSIEGANLDGETSKVTVSLADRQGNPVPDGTVVNFVTEGGVMIPPVCTTGAVPGDSRCFVTIRSQNPRSANGKITILAYAAGEEDFIDTNFNNVYNSGEPFRDLGNAFRDDNEDGSYVDFEDGFTAPRNGTVVCDTSSKQGLSSADASRAGTCDGTWGAVDVRKAATIIFASTTINIDYVGTPTSAWTRAGGISTQLDVVVSDANNNSVPSGSSIVAAAVDTTPTAPVDSLGGFKTCTVTGQSDKSVPNQTGPLNLNVYLKDCVLGDQVQVTVTNPNGKSTTRTFTAP